jgi:hypothetical protein
MSNPKRIPNTQRQQIVTTSGVLLERLYLYLTPELSKIMRDQTHALGFDSTSLYIANLIATSKESNDRPQTLD